MSIPLTDKIAYGTMTLGLRSTPMSFDEAADMINYVVTKYNVKFLNGGEFYGKDHYNLKVFQRYLEKYNSPKNKDLIVSIKGAFNISEMKPDGSKEGIDRSIKAILPYFEVENRPKLLFEAARVDPAVPIENTISYINEYIKQGKLSGVSLSEAGSKSVAKAAKVAPISFVELEFSFFTRDIVDEGVFKVCSDEGIPIIAYSPLGHGMLTDFLVENADKFYEQTRSDFRATFDRFTDENYQKNVEACKKLYDFAHDVKKTTLEALALSWIVKVSESTNLWGVEKVAKIIPIPSSSSPLRADANFGKLVELSDEEFAQVEKIYEESRMVGTRGNAHMAKFMLS
ncbi:hypothetical protein QFC19_004346 [Naganishia cerealis]|uniref:Uncharacterized protein n=1 Tax=Naganishia cerealis TaxID=610337 RepID=A0ACC2VW81_9TREE|nr:hypothetical protein QFC19_004346 [Naganishia cerealis]